MKKLKFLNICKMSEKQLKEYVYGYLKGMGYEPIKADGFVYAKGTVPVLLVAHMDTVHKELPRGIKVSKGFVMADTGIGGDDRCGVYMVLKIAKQLKCSVLFTEQEEVGGIGAAKFCKTRYVNDLGVNYIIELDRKGSDDAVFYDCDNEKFTAFITDKSIGFKENWGTFTDISYICEESGIAGVNLSSGYFKAHTVDEYVHIPTMEKNIERVIKLINKPVSKPYKFIKAKPYYSNYYGYSYSEYGGYYGSNKGGSYSRYYDGYDYDDYDDVRSEYGQGSWYRDETKSSRSVKKERRYVLEIEFKDPETEKNIVHVAESTSKEGCFYEFFKALPNVCFNDIIDWYTAEDSDDEAILG